MQPPLDGRPGRGPRPSTTSAEEKKSVQAARGRGVCQYSTVLKRSTSGSPVERSAYQCSPGRRRPTAPLSQVAHKDATKKDMDSLDTRSHHQETSYEYLAETSSAFGESQRGSDLEQQRGWPSAHRQPASSRVSALPDVAKIAKSFSIDGDGGSNQHSRYSQVRHDADFGRSERGTVRENSANARNIHHTANVLTSGCSQASPPETQQCLQSGEALKRGTWSSPVRVEPALQRPSCDESPFFRKDSPEHINSLFREEQGETTVSPARCHTPGPMAGEISTCAGLDVHQLYQERGSAVPYLSTMYGTACSSELLDPAIQSSVDGGSFTKETSDCTKDSARRGFSSGSQALSPRASISSTFTSFTRSGCSSASTASYASPQRQSECCRTEALDPSVSCSLDLASFSVACQTPPLKSQDISDLSKPTTIAGRQSSPSTPALLAVANADRLPASPVADLGDTKSGEGVPPNAPDNSRNDSTKDRELTAPATKASQAASDPISDVSPTSSALADVSGFAADVNISDIVLSCGLPPPESSAPVSLACRVLMRRYAAAAAAAAEEASRREAGGEKGEGRGGERGSPLKTLKESSRRVHVEQFEDCGWTWQGDGGGLLLLRLQRKQLDKGKVKSAGYEAFGREYGLPVGRSMNNVPPWNLVYSHMNTPMQKDVFKSIITDIRRHFACAAANTYNSGRVLEGTSFSTEPSSHVNQSASAEGGWLGKYPLAETQKTHAEETALTTAPLNPPPCRRSLSSGVSPAGSNGFMKRESAARTSAGVSGRGWALKETDGWSIRAKGEIEDRTFASGWGSGSSQSDLETRPCHCCGDRRKQLVGCTRSASLLESRGEGIADGIGMAAMLSSATQQRSSEAGRGRPTSLNGNELQRKTPESNKQKYPVAAAAASRHSGKRHSTCEGRLEGWRAQQLSVRVILRNTEPPPPPLVRENLPDPAPPRLRKRVTFSVDCFSSDGETAPGVLCRLSPPVQQEAPLRRPLISRVHSSTYRQAGGLLSRSRSDCASVAAAAAPLAAGGRTTAAALTAGAREEKRGEIGPATQKDGREVGGRAADVARQPRGGEDSSSSTSLKGSPPDAGCAPAADVPSETNPPREESFYILVGCRRPTAASRWTRRGRTVVSRNCSRYVGPLLPLVISLLEREREAVRDHGMDERPQAKEDDRGKAQRLKKESPFHWLRKSSPAAESLQQQQLKHPQQQQHPQKQQQQQHSQTQQQQHQQRQQQQQGLLQHQAPRVPQQQLPQQKQPAQPSAQRRQPPQQQQQQMLTKQQGQLQSAWRGDEQRQEQAPQVRRPAAGEVARREPLPRQGWDPVRNEERYSSGGGWRPREYAIYQPPRAPCSHVCPRYYHPLDTPETLFPQARARQLRRLLMLQNGSAFPAVNDPLVLANGLPLLQGGAAAVGALGDGNLAAYQQLGRCSVAARAVAQAAAARRPPVLPQLCHPLQQQHSQRERFFSSPYSLPESSADAQGRLRYGSGGLSGAAGVSPGIWYRRGRSGPVEPLRQAGSCSFTFEPGSVDGGLSAEGMRAPGGAVARRFDTDEDEEEDDEDEEEEEGDFRRRLPRFFRRRRSSDAAAGQGETEERRRLSRFSSLTRRTPQDGSSGGRRITTGERLKRFLVPLFFRGFSSPAADAERQGGEGEGEEDGEQAEVVQENEGAAATRNKDSEQPPGQLGAQLPQEEDDEDLWVTESDASTPPLSSQSSIVIVKKKAAQVNQQQMERTSVREGKEGNGQTVGLPNTPQDTAAGRILRRSATADDVRPSPRLQKPRGRQPLTPALKKVTEEPAEETKTAGKKNSALEVHGAAEKQGTTYHQAEDRKTAVAATEQKPKQSSCESGGQALQQQTDQQILELQRQEIQQEQRPPQQPEEGKGKQVEEKSPHQQRCRPQPHESRQQRPEKGGNECRGQQALQQTTAAAEEKKLSVEGRRPENEVPRGQQDQQTKQQKPQQPPEQRPQQRKRHQQQQGLPVDREQTVREKPKAEHRAEAERAQKPTAHGIKKPHAKDEQLQRRRVEKEEAGISGTLKEVGNMQKQKKERDERRTGSLVGGDEGNSVDAERQAIAKNPSPLKQRPCVLPVKRERNLLGGVTERRPCEQPSAEQQGGRPQVHDDAQPTCAPELGVAAPEVCVSEKKEVPQTCEQQPALEEGPPASLKVLAISGLCSKAEKSVLEDSSSNNENDIFGAGRDVLHTRRKRDGVVDCKRANDRPTGGNICVTGPPKEKPEGKKQEEEGEGGGLGGACSLGGRKSPVPAASRPATLSALAEDDVASEGATPHNAPNTALLMRQGFLANRVCSAEARVLPAQEDNRRRTGGGLRWRWKRSSGRGREDKAVEGVVCLSSPAATASGFSQIGQSAAPAGVLTTAAVPAAGTGASPTAAAGGAAATLTLCADEQVASSTAAGSQQTVSSPLHGWRVPSKKNSLLTAFDQMPSPWSTRSTHENREEQRNLPTLLQRLSTRFRRRRDFGANDSSEPGGAQCTSDTG